MDDYEVKGHAFISYARVDSSAADDLQRILEAAGVRVWRDTGDLWPGQDWRALIRRAITDDALAFIACFSASSTSRAKGYQNEELMLAIEQLRQRRSEDPWLIPVRFDDCVIPSLHIGGGKMLDSIQRVDLFGDKRGEGIARLVAVTLRLLGRNSYDATELASTGPAITDRWRLTHKAIEVPSLTQLPSYGFDHPGYSRPVERTPPWVRIRAVIACAPLGETPRWQELRSRFTDFLSQDPIMSLIGELSEIRSEAQWRPRGTYSRYFLEADLTADGQTAAPLASASLALPEAQVPARLRPGCAQLTLHVDFIHRVPPAGHEQMIFKRPLYWRARFAEALAVPEDLARWLHEQLNLATSDRPPAEFGIMLQDASPITSMIDTFGIPALSAPTVQNQFTGWAVADANGQPISKLASQIMLDLSERVLHLNGTIEEMQGQV